MNDIDLSSIAGLPKEVREMAQKNQEAVKRALLDSMARTLTGRTTFKDFVFHNIEEGLKFLNEKKSTVRIVAILPDFQTYSYHLVYEEDNA